MNSVFYGLALLITALIRTIQGQLDLYHAIFVMLVIACFSIIHLFGMSYIPTRIYGVIINDMRIQVHQDLFWSIIDPSLVSK